MKSTIASGSEMGFAAGRDDSSAPDSAANSHYSHRLSRTAGRLDPDPTAAWRVIQATAGDHALIHPFLVGVTQRPSMGEFQAQLDDPSYEPSDRLLIKAGKEVIAHLRLIRRDIRFGRLIIPATLVADVVTAPEYQGRGCATTLLQAARRMMLHEGTVLGLLRTNQPRFYARRGWVVCGRHCYSAANPRAILSYLSQRNGAQEDTDASVLSRPVRRKYNIRLWRHVEEAALMRLYNDNTQLAYGAIERSEPYWRWLIRRSGHQRVYVAIDGPDKLELNESLAPIVGYAAIRNGRIVEMMCAPDHPEASIQLLARACGDAMEQDDHRMRIDAPPGHVLHDVCVAADGEHRHHEADQGMVFMADLLRPRRFLTLLSHELGDRLREGGHGRACQLGLMVHDEKYRLLVNRRNVNLVSGSLGRSYLKCSRYTLFQLLLGHLDVRDAIDSERVTASTHVARDIAAMLLPRRPFWRPPWDELPAP